jgi:excisionase family DNA binding protein
MIEQLYSTKDVAELLAVTTKAIEKWRGEGKLRPIKVGSLCRYSESEISRFLGIKEDGATFANEQIDESGGAIGELAAAQKEALAA